MPKVTILDRLAGAMKTLGKREGKVLTPRQRVAAAQRWNSLADIGEDEVARLEALADKAGNRGVAQSRYVNADDALEFMNISDGNGFRADNPFLSDNPDKYAEQEEFLDWCHYNRVEPNGQALKQFRWETYKTLPYRQRQWIANKSAILGAVGPGDPIEFRNARTLRDWDAASKEWMGGDWDIQDLPVYNSYEEFPDDFDYMWRY